MPLITFFVPYMIIILPIVIIGVLFLYVTMKRIQNPAQWKSVKLVSDWVDVDTITGNKIKRTQTEFYRVRI